MFGLKFNSAFPTIDLLADLHDTKYRASILTPAMDLSPNISRNEIYVHFYLSNMPSKIIIISFYQYFIIDLIDFVTIILMVTNLQNRLPVVLA